MNKPWIILTKRYGAEINSPSDEQLAEAIHELFNENLPGMTIADYEEHPSAWVRLGYDDGPMYILDINRSGRVTFEQWTDPDFENEMAPTAFIENVNAEKALELWKLVCSDEIEMLKNEFTD